MMDPSKSIQNNLTDRQVSKKDASDRRLLKLSLAALGVVFGDIGILALAGRTKLSSCGER
jgi:K+ transporter